MKPMICPRLITTGGSPGARSSLKRKPFWTPSLAFESPNAISDARGTTWSPTITLALKENCVLLMNVRQARLEKRNETPSSRIDNWPGGKSLLHLQFHVKIFFRLYRARCNLNYDSVYLLA